MASTTASAIRTTERSEVLRAAGVALLLGFGLIFLTGFAYPESYTTPRTTLVTA